MTFLSLSLFKALLGARAFLVLFFFAAALFLSNLDAYKDFVRAESYFALGARLMVVEGDWLAPHAPDEPVLNKPPLQYWLTGFFYRVFGTSYTTARLPSALAALALLVVVYLLGVGLKEERAGLLAGMMLATSYLFYTFARTAMSDMLLTLCVSAALSCFIMVLAGRSSRTNALLFCGYVFVALGVLAKGPVAIILTAAPLAIEILLARDYALLKKLRPLSGTLVVAALAAPYFLLLYFKFGAAPLRAFFIGENLQRFTGAIYAASARPVWYLFPAFFSDFAPWSLLLPLAIYYGWRARASVKDETRRVRRILYIWLLFPLVFFSFSNFKLDYYLLPSLPAAALVIGGMLAHAGELPRTARALIYAFTIFFAVVVLSAAIISVRLTGAILPEARWGWLPVLTALGALVLVLYCTRRGWLSGAVRSLAAGICLTLVFYQWTLAPAFGRYQPISRLAQSVPAEGRVYTSHGTSDWANTLAFHLAPNRAVSRLAPDRDASQLVAIMRQERGALALVKEEEYVRLLDSGIRVRSLAEGDTFGHAGLTFEVLRRPKPERLRIVQSETSGHE